MGTFKNRHQVNPKTKNICSSSVAEVSKEISTITGKLPAHRSFTDMDSNTSTFLPKNTSYIQKYYETITLNSNNNYEYGEKTRVSPKIPPNGKKVSRTEGVR